MSLFFSIKGYLRVKMILFHSQSLLKPFLLSSKHFSFLFITWIFHQFLSQFNVFIFCIIQMSVYESQLFFVSINNFLNFLMILLLFQFKAFFKFLNFLIFIISVFFNLSFHKFIKFLIFEFFFIEFVHNCKFSPQFYERVDKLWWKILIIFTFFCSIPCWLWWSLWAHF